jgi:hypothetical protein
MRSWLVVAEARADATMLGTLADKVLVEAHPWAAGILDDLRRYVGLDDARPHTTWGALKDLAQAHRLRVQGRFGAGHGGAARLELRRIHTLWARGHLRTDAVLVHRDTDEHLERSTQAREERDVIEAQSPDLPLCLAHPHPEMEAWRLVIAGARTAEEQARHGALRQELGFDPIREPERLGAGAEHDHAGRPILRNAKSTLKTLHPDPGVVADRVAAAPLGDLQACPGSCGLGTFLDDVRKRLPPQVGEA